VFVAEIPIERKPRRQVGLILLLLVLIVIGGIGWWWWSNNQNAATTSTPTTGIRSSATAIVALRDFYMDGV
jgi:multidrug resistance efflux pump